MQYRLDMKQQLDPTLSHLNLVHTLTSYFCNIYFNIILQHTPRYLQKDKKCSEQTLCPLSYRGVDLYLHSKGSYKIHTFIRFFFDGIMDV